MTELRFETIRLRCGRMGPESAVPDIIEQDILQNRLSFSLSETDEIYEGYGRRPNAYPYRQQECYSRELREQDVEAAVLENEWMKAVFLPGFGGRLWKLFDKVAGRDVVYENDVLRASNLALRNAWFSGGVEWNCGVIGHTPFTMDRIFAARMEKDGIPVLRMYSYERIRGVVYQMDFWLDEHFPALNCHMSVNNSSLDVVPMYWWTNIASPLYPGGRLLAPGHKAYTYDRGTIIKVDIPNPEPGVDVSRYETIPVSRDYFFELDPGAPRWVVNVDRTGHGMLHTSTARLQSRKLFVWGQQPGSLHWQKYLTEQAGDYIELQAGLGKTQYGCIPMAPNTTWEWTERFESVALSEEQQAMSFDMAAASLSCQLVEQGAMAPADRFGRELLHERAEQVICGCGDAALEQSLREKLGERPLWKHLDYSSDDPRQALWTEFLSTGILREPEGFPACDPTGVRWLKLLRESLKKPGGENWYSLCCISMLEREQGRQDLAETAIDRSLALKQTPCNLYVKAVYLCDTGEKQEAARLLCAGLEQGRDNESYVRAVLHMLLVCGQWQTVLDQIGLLSEEMRAIPRICMDKAHALCELGEDRQAMDILEKDGAMVLDDIREGDIGMGELWCRITEKLTGRREPLPMAFDFDALGPARETKK